MNKATLTELFAPVSKEQWLNQIRQDLKGQDISDLFEHIAEGWEINPFEHAEDLSADEINLLEFDRTGHAIPLQVVTGSESRNMNAEAIDHLKNGAGSLLIRKIGNVDIASVMRDIDTSLAPVFYDGKSDLTRQISSYRFTIELGQPLVDDTCQWLIDLYSSKQCLPITVGLSDHIFHNICGLRALRVLHRQLMSDLGIDTSLTIVAEYGIDQEQDLAYNLQTSMPKVLAAVLGGADHITCPQGIEQKEARWYHNLVHLLTLEADLPLNKDLISGSFYLETLTNQIADRTWEKFLKTVNNK